MKFGTQANIISKFVVNGCLNRCLHLGYNIPKGAKEISKFRKEKRYFNFELGPRAPSSKFLNTLLVKIAINILYIYNIVRYYFMGFRKT